MGERIRGLILLVVVLAAGIFVGSAVSQWKPLPEQERREVRPRNAPANTLGRVRVEVLNAGGEPGMARLATEHLRDLGFDVVYFGNAEAFDQDSTVVLDRSGKPEMARAVVAALEATTVRTEPDENLYLDVTVLLGRDWTPALSSTESEAAGEDDPWWDLRRYFR